jgi:hypothetical protein
MTIVGILSIRNAVGLDYPFGATIASMAGFCDDVIVGVDPRFSDDFIAIQQQNECGEITNVHIQHRSWNDNNISAGSEIAIQMDALVKSAKEDFNADWVIVLQADEVLHEKDEDMIKEFCKRAKPDVKGFSLERLYFWKDTQTIREDWNAHLVRVFRPERFSFLAEGTDKAGMYSGPLDDEGVVVELPYKIYHYSRVGAAEDISKRVRNLDGFFHEASDLVPVTELEDYDFVTREYDNFSTKEAPKEVEGKFVKFKGKHPMVIAGMYD